MVARLTGSAAAGADGWALERHGARAVLLVVGGLSAWVRRRQGRIAAGWFGFATVERAQAAGDLHTLSGGAGAPPAST